MYNLEVFSIFTELCNHHLSQFSNTSVTPLTNHIPSHLSSPIPSPRLQGHSSFTRPSPDALYYPEEPLWTYRSAHHNRSADPLTTTQNPVGTPWVGTFHSSWGLAGHMAPGPCQGRVVWLEQPSLFKFVNKYTYS